MIKNTLFDDTNNAVVVQVLIMWLDKLLEYACNSLEVDASADMFY